MSTPEPRYVRFGDLPRKRSLNLLAGERLAGVSCYAGRFVEPDLFRMDTSDLTPQGIAALIAFLAADRPAFFVEGEEIGTGPDGEPLLRIESARPVPMTTNVTSIEGAPQPALSLWSQGPRDGAASRALIMWRLCKESGYVPDSMDLGTQESPAAVAARRKKPGAKGRQKAQKKARKKQRAKKK